MSEIFSLRGHGPASSLATMANWLFVFIVTKTYDSMQDTLTTQGTYWFFAGGSFLGFIFVYILIPETKGEEVEALFDKDKLN